MHLANFTLVYRESNLPASIDDSGFNGLLTSFFLESTLAGVSSLTIQTFGLDISGSDNDKEIVQLRCPSGQIATNLNLVDYGLIKPERNHKHINNIYSIDCNNWASFFYSLQDCEGKSECDVEFKHSWLIDSCHSKDIYNNNNLVVKYYCAGKTPKIFSNGPNYRLDSLESSVKSEYSDYMIISFFLVVVFQIFLTWLWLNEIFYIQKYEKSFRSPDEYSLVLKNLPMGMNRDGIYDYILK